MRKYKKEIWKDIPGYEGLYQASTFGNIRNRKGDVLCQYLNEETGYLTLNLCKKNIARTKSVHRLVALTFKGLSNLVVGHDDDNKQNNHIDNLEYITHRENLSKHALGVHYSVYGRKKYRVRIVVNGKLTHFGSFKTEEEAISVYQRENQKLIQYDREKI